MSSLPPQCNLSPVPLLTLWFNLLHVYFHSSFTALNLSGAAVSPASAAFPLILFIPQSLIAQHLLAADIVREPGCVWFLRKVLIFLLFSSKQDNGDEFGVQQMKSGYFIHLQVQGSAWENIMG